ncbi:hypothetical protein MRX96_057653 [Rhipicephalus microplus]
MGSDMAAAEEGRGRDMVVAALRKLPIAAVSMTGRRHWRAMSGLIAALLAVARKSSSFHFLRAPPQAKRVHLRVARLSSQRPCTPYYTPLISPEISAPVPRKSSACACASHGVAAGVASVRTGASCAGRVARSPGGQAAIVQRKGVFFDWRIFEEEARVVSALIVLPKIIVLAGRGMTCE